jgi:hypothetical protein
MVVRAQDLIWIYFFKPTLAVGPLLCRRAETVRTKPLVQSHRTLDGPGGLPLMLYQWLPGPVTSDSLIGLAVGRIYWCRINQE